jgi:Brp/Blh family beta-carotene 15,15'-monooxygenase
MIGGIGSRISDKGNFMLQIILIIGGFLLLLTQQYIQPFPDGLQLNLFLLGIILLGVPHGAADLLVAMRNSGSQKKSFSKIRFFISYLSRLVLFAAILWLFPLAGIILFIIFAAYHFGETDLHHYRTDTILGKMLVTSYGLVILSVLLFVHLDEVKPILQILQPGFESAHIFDFIKSQRTVLIILSGVSFMLISVIYKIYHKSSFQKKDVWFLFRFGMILIIIFNLPLIMGFSFYFIVWHSVLSMTNIFQYLRRDNLIPFISILKQIGLYSLLAMAGILLIGLTGIMFLNSHAMMGYVFMGLAVLTAPHMQVMHDMYNKIRAN